MKIVIMMPALGSKTDTLNLIEKEGIHILFISKFMLLLLIILSGSETNYIQPACFEDLMETYKEAKKAILTTH